MKKKTILILSISIVSVLLIFLGSFYVMFAKTEQVIAANKNDDWYYTEKKWANAVMVTDNSTYADYLADTSSNGFDAKLVNGAHLVKVDGESAIELDGVDDYIELPTLPSTIDFASGYTVEVTMKWKTSDTFARIMDFGNGSGYDNLVIANWDGTPYIAYYNGTVNTNYPYSSLTLSENVKETYKFELIKGSEYYTLNMYLNGTLKATNSNTIAVGAFQNIERTKNYIGKSNWDNPYLNAYIYDFKISDSNGNVIVSYDADNGGQTIPDTYGGFKIVKKDGDNVALPGVKFKVGTNLNGTEGTDWSYMTTDVNGEIKVENIKSGTKMYYQEVSTKDGYVLDGNIYNLSIKANEIITVTVLNYKNDKVMFKLLKTNEGGGPLPGVKFKVGTNLNGTEGTDWSYMITDANGVITVGNIPKGTTYYYQEISTLDGYIVDNTIKKVILDVDNGIYVKREVNYLDRVATIVKRDAETGQVLRNVVFEIYDATTDKLLYTKTTDALGKIVLKGVSNGKYYAKEKSAPDGYLLNTDKHSFEISDTNKSVEIVITNKKDNPNTGSTLIYVTMVLGLICLCVLVVQHRRLKNVTQ